MGKDTRIFLVNPPYERIARGYAFIKHLTNRSPSLGLLHRRVRRRYVKESIRNPVHLVRLARAGLGFGMAKARSYLEGRRGLLIDRDETHLDSRPEPVAAGTVAGSRGSGCGSSDTRRFVKLKVTR